MDCPHCKNSININEGLPLYCPWCGGKLNPDTDEAGLASMLLQAKSETDSVKKHDILIKAKEIYGVRREIEKELLLLGRLYERGGKPDFYRIPYWPLNAIEKPREFSKRDRQKMLDSFFSNPQLMRVAEMYEDRMAFINEYLTSMSEEYVRTFMQNSNTNLYFLGFRRKADDVRSRCEGCMIRMLQNLKNMKEIPDDMKTPMRNALIEGFGRVFGEASAAELINI